MARSIDDYNAKTFEFYVHNTLTQDEEYNVVWSNHTKNYDIKTQLDFGKRYLPLENSLFKDLIPIIEEQKPEECSNPKNLLFWDYEYNKFVTPSEVNSWLARINKKYNISKDGLSTHRLRHTALTYWKELGIDLSVIQYLAGHIEGSDVTENTYIDIRPEYIVKELQKVS